MVGLWQLLQIGDAYSTQNPRYASGRVLVRLNTCGLLKRASLERKKSTGGRTRTFLTCFTKVRFGALHHASI